MVATVPTSNKSSAVGSAISGLRFATNRMFCSPAAAAFKPRIERSVPTNSGWMPCGKTTIWRSGRTASPVSMIV